MTVAAIRGTTKLSLVVLLVSGLLAGAAATAPPAEALVKTPEKKMARLINRARVEHGLPKVRIVGGLSDVARKHSRKMRSEAEIFHSELGAVLSSFNWSVAGENVGVGSGVWKLHKAFMNSPGHRANILEDGYRKVGIGFVRDGDGRAYVTVMLTD
ncbi:MAG TPA: CAP domain-containing protein [Actinomycetota bacterium]